MFNVVIEEKEKAKERGYNMGNLVTKIIEQKREGKKITRGGVSVYYLILSELNRLFSKIIIIIIIIIILLTFEVLSFEL